MACETADCTFDCKKKMSSGTSGSKQVRETCTSSVLARIAVIHLSVTWFCWQIVDMANVMAHTSCLQHPLHRTDRSGSISQPRPCNSRSRLAFCRHYVRRQSNVHAHSTEAPPKPKVRPGEKKGVARPSTQALPNCPAHEDVAHEDYILCGAGFVEEMRFVAMKLHTKDQSPKEGGKEAAPQPFQKVGCGY